MRILVVEDDAALAGLLRDALSRAGYAVDMAGDGEEGHFLGDTEPYDAVVLDLGLPRLDGLTVLKRWRADGRNFPVLILTARDRWTEKVEGMDAGADDYLTKPFQMEELLARVRALIRRAKGHASAELVCGELRLDTRHGAVTLAGRPVSLTANEFKVLSYLMHRKGEVVSQADLIEHIYAQDFERDSNTIEVFIGRLRKKLGAEWIETVRGLGYRLREARRTE
ncbi:MAG: response regulator transcription factor [Rhodospirillales bacterium]|nr:response regulator transcription factor [Rhodospirillales bacterium]